MAYTLYLVLAATRSATLAFSVAMTRFVVPLSVLTLAVATVRAARRR